MAALTDRVNVGVGVIVWNEDGQVLLGKRIADKHGKGEFSLPGGKPDPGEDPAFAAARELYEETGLVAYGLTVLPHWTYDVYREDGVHFVTLYFQCWLSTDQAALLRNCEPEKCEGWDWYDSEALPEPLFSGALDAIERAG